MTQKEQTLEWLRYAQHDLDSAQHLTMLVPAPNEIICFHCQQAAEKALKALLVIQDREVPRIHDLQKLWTLLVPEFPELADFKLHCIILSGFGALVRYPLNLEVPDNQVPRALHLAAEISGKINQLVADKDFS